MKSLYRIPLFERNPLMEPGGIGCVLGTSRLALAPWDPGRRFPSSSGTRRLESDIAMTRMKQSRSLHHQERNP